jgi:hypothetical protein
MGGAGKVEVKMPTETMKPEPEKQIDLKIPGQAPKFA